MFVIISNRKSVNRYSIVLKNGKRNFCRLNFFRFRHIVLFEFVVAVKVYHHRFYLSGSGN